MGAEGASRLQTGLRGLQRGGEPGQAGAGPRAVVCHLFHALNQPVQLSDPPVLLLQADLRRFHLFIGFLNCFQKTLGFFLQKKHTVLSTALETGGC